MNINQLRYFVTAAENGSLTKAAEVQHVVQPAISQSIRSLEEELDIKLFKRVPRGVELTPGGQELLGYAKTILLTVEQAQLATTGAEHSPAGYVKVGLPSTLCRRLISPLYNISREKYPRIKLGIESGLADVMRQQAIDGNLDLIVQYMASNIHSLESHPLIETGLYLVGTSKVLAGNDDIEFRELVNYPIVYAGTQATNRQFLDKHADNAGIKLDYIPLHAPFFPAYELVKQGTVFSILPYFAVHDEFIRGDINARKIINPTMERTVYLTTPINRKLSHAALKIREVMFDAILPLQTEEKTFTTKRVQTNQEISDN